MAQLSLMIDLERCIGCKSCEAACKAEHGLGPTENRNRVVWLGEATQPGLDFLALSCQHCERPACLRACPVVPNAITKDPDTGVVALDETRCTGCGECVVACPYGAMGYDMIDHHAVKCDLCADRRQDGLRPACATACPGGAISFDIRDNNLAKAARDNRQTIDHDAFLLGPSNIFLERRSPCPSDTAPINLLAFTVKQKQHPPVVDDAKRKMAFSQDDIAFPYRHSRAERAATHVVPGV